MEITHELLSGMLASVSERSYIHEHKFDFLISVAYRLI
jgi:hypothetical protein